MMKTSLTHFILEQIGEAGEITLNAFFPKKYSHTHLSRHLFGLDSSPEASPQTLVSILSRLKRQGLVERRGDKGASSWSLTDCGKERIKKHEESLIPKAKSDGISRLVIFDIPERERRKRDIIRAELIGYDFRQLQKSVWIGHAPLPVDFVEMIDALGVKEDIHIFSIKESGTLQD